jgi:hypothetical protein
VAVAEMPCQNVGVATRSNASASIESLVDHMFDQVLTADERAELLIRIRAWEAANPDVDNAHRITGWIDVAYEFQASNLANGEVRGPVRSRAQTPGTLFLVPVSA